MSSFVPATKPLLTAVILAAGRGSRMETHTVDLPKCLLEVSEGSCVLGLQLDRLRECPEVGRIVVVTGYRTRLVEAFVAARRDENIEVAFNPFYDVSNNLHSLWLARQALTDGGLIINGDDLFHPDLLPRVVKATGDFVVTTNRKDTYDADDMKVQLDGMRLTRIGKELELAQAHGEAIGIIRISPTGAGWLTEVLDDMVRQGDRNCFYLRAVQRLIDLGHPVVAKEITPLPWAEIDEPCDLEFVRKNAAQFTVPRESAALATPASPA